MFLVRGDYVAVAHLLICYKDLRCRGIVKVKQGSRRNESCT